MSEELMQPTTKDRFLTETDPKELQKIVDMFNLNIKKKNILRAERISEIQDNILNQISARVVKRPDEFSNTDLLNYFKAMQDTLLKNPAETELPEIHITQNNQVNINTEGGEQTPVLNRMSRERVALAVRNILAQAQGQLNSVKEGTIIDVNPEEIDVEDIPIDIFEEDKRNDKQCD